MGPQSKLGERVEAPTEIDKAVGGASGAGRAPPRMKFPPLYQCVATDQQWGPTSVLIHIGVGPASDFNASICRPVLWEGRRTFGGATPSDRVAAMGAERTPA